MPIQMLIKLVAGTETQTTIFALQRKVGVQTIDHTLISPTETQSEHNIE